jgi:hypothetical protein
MNSFRMADALVTSHVRGFWARSPGAGPARVTGSRNRGRRRWLCSRSQRTGGTAFQLAAWRRLRGDVPRNCVERFRGDVCRACHCQPIAGRGQRAGHHGRTRACDPTSARLVRKSGLGFVRIEADHDDQELDAIGFAARA